MAQIKKNILYLLVVQGGSYLVPLLMFPYLVRVLGIEGFGRLMFAQAWVQYLILVSDYGFNLGGTREVARRHAAGVAVISQLFWNINAAKVLLLGVCVGLTVGASRLSVQVEQNLMLILILSVGALGNVFSSTWLFQGLERMKLMTWVSLPAKLVALPLLLVLVQGQGDLAAAAWALAISQGAGGVLALAIIRGSRLVAWARPTVAGVLSSLREGWSLFVSIAAMSLYATANTILVGLMAGSIAVGYFAAADKIVRAIVGLFGPVSQAVFPRVNILMADAMDDALKLLRRLLRLQALATAIVSLVLFILAPHIVQLIFGAGYEASATVIRILSPLPFLIGVSNVHGTQLMLPLGMNAVFMRIMLGAGVGNLVLIVPLAHYHAQAGAAGAVLSIEAIVAAVMILVMRRRGFNLLSRSTGGSFAT